MFDYTEFGEVLRGVLSLAMSIFRQYQVGLQTIDGIRVKEGDASLVTVVDSAVEELVLGQSANSGSLGNGAKGVVGAVTLVRGWPWDVCGVRLALEAGGSARAFYIENGTLNERPPLHVNCYGILVAGNNPAPSTSSVAP